MKRAGTGEGKGGDLRGRPLAALRACALYPLGLRHGAYPSAMPELARRGLVAERPMRAGRQLAWFVTPAGQAALARHGRGQPDD